MATISLILTMTGGLGLFLLGMKKMSSGLQESTGERMRTALSFMTGNRFAGVFTGFIATAIIQSSSAFTIIVISFVNAGLLTLTQSIGVILGTNIGTTVTGWVISLVGLKISIASLALPAIGIGFFISISKWKYKSLGDFLLGFGFLFLGLYFLTDGMSNANDIFSYDTIGALRDKRILAMLTGVGVGLVMTVIINSSTASVTLIMALAFQDIITYEMAAGMILGSNLGSTFTAALAGMAGNVNSKRAALVHILFNIAGIIWALPFIFPLLNLVNVILPGDPWAAGPGNAAIPVHIAGLHTLYNIINTLLFLPFVNQYAKLILRLIPDKAEEKSVRYKFCYLSTAIADSPELNVMRAEKEITSMAGIVFSMYSNFCTVLRSFQDDNNDNKTAAEALCAELKQKDEYVDEMRYTLSKFLIECSGMNHNTRSESHISYLLQVIVTLKAMSDECCNIGLFLEKSVDKKCVFKEKELIELIPYTGQVEELLTLLEVQLSCSPQANCKNQAMELEDKIERSQKNLQKMERKRIEAGGNIKAKLLFIDLVRHIKRLGDYCFEIYNADRD
ncbi:MAG: Na/Pi cotransporter family protein [Treponema sp.]|nr:Na/Pi cotransporter family protein [Treponema sp.]